MSKLTFKALNKDNVSDCLRGWVSAFPSWKAEDALKQAKKNIHAMYYFGAYEGNTLKGVIVGAETRFCYRGKVVKDMELEHIHVEPLYRKQGVSRFMIEEFEKFVYGLGYSVINLGPFNTEFYRNMGYGFGPKTLSFSSKPENFMYYDDSCNKLKLYKSKEYKDELKSFLLYQRTDYHGSWSYNSISFNELFDELSHENYVAIMHIEDSKICGVLSYKADKEIIVDNFFFDTPSALKALSSYLHTLKGNTKSITIKYAQPAILCSCNNPYDITLSEISMIKIINIRKFIDELSDIDFANYNLNMKFILHNTLNQECNSVYISCCKGKLRISESNKFDVEIKMLLSDFSSLLFSQQSFKTYIQAGLAKISDKKYIDIVSYIFNYTDTPYVV